MTHVIRRRRGTAIVEINEGILVTAGNRGIFILPGGGANRGETRMRAAVRELREETGLQPYYSKFLFRHEGKINPHGFRDYHTVCLVKANGRARPLHEIRHIAYYKPGSNIRISTTTKEIIERYYQYKKRNRRHQSITSVINKFMDWLSI